jgi:glycosyltransferase involved in cell wall biosynthesis
MNHKSILYVGNDIRYFIMHRLPLAIAAREAGYVVYAALPGGEGENRILDSGIKIHHIPLRRGGIHIYSDAATAVALYKLYRRLKPDIVHHHTIKPVIYGGVVARLAGQKSVVSGITGLGYAFIGHGLRSHVLRYVTTRAYKIALAHPRSRVIFQNSDDQKMFIERSIVSADVAKLIKGSGVDLIKYRVKSESSGKSSVMLVSRMLWDKGIGEFVEAAKLLKLRGVESRFILVGDVDNTNPGTIPLAQMRRWNESGVVEWMGWIDDVSDLYEKADIVCLPSSYREGVPRSLIEAAACGKPIVTTDAPGCREIVRHCENGYLVPVGDAKSLANALQRLIENPDLRRSMGARSREIAEKEFSMEKVIKETLDVYRELLQ